MSSPPATRSSSSRPTRSTWRSAPRRRACSAGFARKDGEDVKVGELLGVIEDAAAGAGAPQAEAACRNRGSGAAGRRAASGAGRGIDAR